MHVLDVLVNFSFRMTGLFFIFILYFWRTTYQHISGLSFPSNLSRSMEFPQRIAQMSKFHHAHAFSLRSTVLEMTITHLREKIEQAEKTISFPILNGTS